MKSSALTVKEYLQELPADRKEMISTLRQLMLDNLPKGFSETMGYGMIGYVVPHTLYPPGYHCDRSKPLPFINIASQKNFIAFYHMGLYADKPLYNWFIAEYAKHSHAKLDMGKACLRFKKPEHIPYELLGQLATKVTVDDWIATYEREFNRKPA
jgi:hypothetical protein